MVEELRLTQLYKHRTFSNKVFKQSLCHIKSGGPNSIMYTFHTLSRLYTHDGVPVLLVTPDTPALNTFFFKWLCVFKREHKRCGKIEGHKKQRRSRHTLKFGWDDFKRIQGQGIQKISASTTHIHTKTKLNGTVR